MLKSMTGFGRAEQTTNDKTFLVEIKALNGKQFELQLRLPPLLRPYEFEIRNILQEHLVRGTIDCMVVVKQNGTSKPVNINTDLIKAYYKQITEVATECNMDTSAVLSALLRLPEVVTPTNDVISEPDFIEFNKVLLAALGNLNQHRMDEGASLEKDLIQRIDNINQQEEAILVLEPNRKKRIKDDFNSPNNHHVYWDTYSKEQLNALADLCFLLCAHYGIPYQCVPSSGFFENAKNFNGIVSKSNFSDIYTDINPSFNFRILFNNAKESNNRV